MKQTTKKRTSTEKQGPQAARALTRRDNPYTPLGLGLVLFGTALAIVSYFILDSIALTALGISFLILGAVCISLAGTRPRLSPEVSRILLETGVENSAALVEELGLTAKAVYLPSSMAEGGGMAVIPLAASTADGLQISGKIAKRLIVKYGSGDGDMGVMVATPGAACLRLLGGALGSAGYEMESALNSIIIGSLDAADGIRVNASGDRVKVEIDGPRLDQRNIKLYQCLGSPLASIAAAVVCESADMPVTIDSESRSKGKMTLELRAVR